MYPSLAVTALIEEQFIPVRVHIKENPTPWHKYGIRWTPTVIALSSDGKEVRRIEGFQPTNDMLGQLRLMLGYDAANRKDWKAAERWFNEAAEGEGAEETDAGPEGVYWRGVARYSASHDSGVLKALKKELEERYPGSSWAKRTLAW